LLTSYRQVLAVSWWHPWRLPWELALLAASSRVASRGPGRLRIRQCLAQLASTPRLEWHKGDALKTEAEMLFASGSAMIAGAASPTMGIVSADDKAGQR